jgi:pantetheine-phosphate adenylyltransferase
MHYRRFMVTTAIYPGSFNPWHAGHADVLEKALKVFDRVVIAIGHNASKPKPKPGTPGWFYELREGYGLKVGLLTYDGLLSDAVRNYNDKILATGKDIPQIGAVIRGLRNGYDLQYEMNFQYWNEDLGLLVPIVFFITDRSLGHISSSTIREIEAIRSVPKDLL